MFGVFNEIKNCGFGIEIIGTDTIYMEGFKTIMEFSNEYIAVTLVDKKVAVLGKDLSLSYITNDTVEIKGKIASLEFL